MLREYFLNTSNFQIQFFKQVCRFESHHRPYHAPGLVVKLRGVLDLFYCLMEEQEGGSGPKSYFPATTLGTLRSPSSSSSAVLKLFQNGDKCLSLYAQLNLPIVEQTHSSKGSQNVLSFLHKRTKFYFSLKMQVQIRYKYTPGEKYRIR